MNPKGRKNDTGKLRFDLIPPIALWKFAEVYTLGAKKYNDRNWEKGIKFGRIFAAMMRHAWRWWAGEEHDKTDGQHHLAAVMWCAAALLHYLYGDQKKYAELDDRPEGNIL